MKELKNKVAINNNFDSFEMAIRYTFNRELLQSEKDFLNKLIDDLVDEACKKQREICADKATLVLSFDYSSSYIERESILNAPSPKESDNEI